jgi:hypothetical protein
VDFPYLQISRRRLEEKTMAIQHRVRILQLVIPLLLLMPAVLFGAEVRHVRVTWEYDGSIENVAGFRLYNDGNIICATNDPLSRAMECNPLLESGPASFTMTAYDLAGNESAHSSPLTMAVPDTNSAPTISGTPAITVTEGEVYDFTPVAHDADAGDNLAFTVTNKPPWISFDQANGTLTGIPDNNDVGTTSNIIITVTDSFNASASLPPFNLTVNNLVAQGDIDDNGIIDLHDLYLVQEILAGRTLDQDRKIYVEADVDGDRKIGMEEAQYILQRISQVR